MSDLTNDETLRAAQEFLARSEQLDVDEREAALEALPKRVQREYHRMHKAQFFVPENARRSTEYLSPSGKYKLVVTQFATRKGSWSYSRGSVYERDTDRLIATIDRNFSSFPFLFVEDHDNGHDYLIAGEDYQGQTVIELDTGLRRDHLPEEAHNGFGFCWAEYRYERSAKLLVVDGCHWACPYEFRFYDFSDPMNGWPQIGNEICIYADRRSPSFLPDGSIQIYQSVVEDDNDEEDDQADGKREVAAWTIYRRDGSWLVKTQEWISDAEQKRRRDREEARVKYDAWWTEFKASDPLYLAMLEGVRYSALQPEDHVSVGATYAGWCSQFHVQEARICRRIHKREGKIGYTIDLEWGAKTGPIKLVIYKDGNSHDDVFFEGHSVDSMKAAIAFAIRIVSGAAS